MTARRLLATATLIAAATVTLTACSGTTTSASSSASPSVSVTAQPASATPSAGNPVPTMSPVAPTGSVAPRPAADCTTAAKKPGHAVINVAASGPSGQLSAKTTKFVCGPDVPNDGYYEAVGEARGYTLAPGVTANLMSFDAQAAKQNVSLAKLLEHINACTHGQTVAQPYGCYGNNYDVTVDSSGAITNIHELYHP